MPKRWRIRPHDAALVAALERSVGVSAIVARLLAARGTDRPPTERASDLLPPDALLDIDSAARRIADAIDRGERIVIVAGIPFATIGTTNNIRVVRV
mgnify:CR=1 FL=1